MKNITSTIVFIAAIAAFAGCNSDPGPDSISSHGGGQGGGNVSSCTTVCHIPGGTVGPDPLTTNGTGTAGKHIAHVTSRGITCVKCHFNYDNNPAHFNGVVNSKGVVPSPVHFDSSNETGTWSYVAPSGTCSSTTCHRPFDPDWYSAATVTLDTVCSNCHYKPLGTIRRQITGTAGDFATNVSVTSYHVIGGDPTPPQCTVCHDQSLHMGGTVRLRHADTGTRIDFAPTNPSTLEPFCLSCHDTDGALATAITASALNPFADGQTLGVMPYLASTTIASSWTGSSTHRSRGLTCAGTGAPNTGCHGRNGEINAHGSVNKGILTNIMNFQIPLVSLGVYTSNPLGSSDYANNYTLCFDCHASYPAVTKEVVLGYRSSGAYNIEKAPSPYFTIGMQSLFRDRFISNSVNYPPSWGGSNQPYNDTMWGDPYLALHNYHLLGFEANALAPDPTENMLQWKYRGDPARIGRITCTACHNVHGTAAATIRSTHAELGLQQDYFGVLQPGESYTSIDPLISEATMTSFPLNCAVACHGVMGQSSYWHTPNGE